MEKIIAKLNFGFKSRTYANTFVPVNRTLMQYQTANEFLLSTHIGNSLYHSFSPTIRTANIRQKKGQNRAAEWLQVSKGKQFAELQTVRNSALNCLNSPKKYSRYIYPYKHPDMIETENIIHCNSRLWIT